MIIITKLVIVIILQQHSLVKLGSPTDAVPLKVLRDVPGMTQVGRRRGCRKHTAADPFFLQTMRRLLNNPVESKKKKRKNRERGLEMGGGGGRLRERDRDRQTQTDTDRDRDKQRKTQREAPGALITPRSEPETSCSEDKLITPSTPSSHSPPPRPLRHPFE